MANVNPFAPNSAGSKTLSVSNSSSSVTLDPKDVSSSTSVTGTSGSNITRGPVGGHNVIRLYNSGPAVCYIRWGTGAQTALTTDMILVPGVVEVFSKAYSDDTVAAITSSSTCTVYITCGEGS
jgi:hypothetical protein